MSMQVESDVCDFGVCTWMGVVVLFLSRACHAQQADLTPARCCFPAVIRVFLAKS